MLGLEGPLETPLEKCWHFTDEVLGTGERQGPPGTLRVG